MAKFETVTGGNIANSPLKGKTPMSPTEVAAFEVNSQITDAVTQASTEGGPAWETISEEHWNDTRLGETISNKFHRVTRRMEVAGGYLYSVATYALTYVRGVSNCSVTETMEFVPEKTTKK